MYIDESPKRSRENEMPIVAGTIERYQSRGNSHVVYVAMILIFQQTICQPYPRSLAEVP